MRELAQPMLKNQYGQYLLKMADDFEKNGAGKIDEFQAMNILVTGANGQLGNEMRIVAKDSKDKYIFTDVVEVEGQETTILDITNLDAVRNIVREYGVNVIVNCAAWTNVDGAEDPEKYDLVELLNAKAPENLAIAMKEVNGLLVHISTDFPANVNFRITA